MENTSLDTIKEAIQEKLSQEIAWEQENIRIHEIILDVLKQRDGVVNVERFVNRYDICHGQAARERVDVYQSILRPGTLHKTAVKIQAVLEAQKQLELAKADYDGFMSKLDKHFSITPTIDAIFKL
jgi:uncharacterized protein (DUF2344 family)